MRLIIISGVSGSGKSVALHALEDLDYYCIDNLPVGMLPTFSQLITNPANSTYRNFAVGIDARNLASDFELFPALLKKIRSDDLRCEIVFIKANDATLIKRFSETRRKHPLTSDDTPLSEAIMHERKLLEPISSHADLILDTSLTNVHQLRNLVREQIHGAENEGLSLLFESFGFKRGIPINADFIFDVRCLPNPHWVTELRTLTGHDKKVIEYLEHHEEVSAMLKDILSFIQRWIPQFDAENRSYLTVAIGCTGGQHRSVYFVDQLAANFKALGKNVLARHRDMP